MASTRQGYIALKRQTISTPETAVVPTHFLRFKEGDLEKKVDNIVNNPLQNNVWGALNTVQGKITCEGSFKFDLDANESVHIIAGALGGLSSADVSSGTDASVYTHTITTATALPCFSWEQGKGDVSDTTNNSLNYRVMRGYGVYIDSFTMRGSDGIIELESSLQATGIFDMARMLNNEASGSSVVIDLDTVEGLVATTDSVNIYDDTPQNEIDAIASLSAANKTITIATLGNSYTVANRARVMLAPLTPSYGTAAQIMTNAMVNFQFGANLSAAASAAEENVENWEISYMNNLEARYGTSRASPTTIAPKARSCKLKFTKYFQSRLDADRYFMNTRRAAIVTISNGAIVSATDTANLKYTVQLKLSDIRYTNHEMPTGTDDLFAYDIEAEAFYDTSDARAIQCLITNAKAGTEYTA